MAAPIDARPTDAFCSLAMTNDLHTFDPFAFLCMSSM